MICKIDFQFITINLVLWGSIILDVVTVTVQQQIE